MDVSIIIVSYNTRQMTLHCLESIAAQTGKCSYEVIVVDNMSSDGSAESIRAQFPEIALLEPQANLGFAKANNLAAKAANGRYLLLLNPDTIVLDAAIDKLVDFADEFPQKSIFGGRTLNADGSLNPSSCWGRPTLWSMFCFALGLSSLGKHFALFDSEAMRRWKRDSVREVDIISGCFLLLERDLWEKLAGFDPEFVMYGEDFDLCLRARKAGARCIMYPGASIVHYGSASEAVKPDQLVKQMRAKVQLMRKHWSSVGSRIGVILLKLRVLTRTSFIRWTSRNDEVGRKLAGAWRETWSRREEWTRIPR